jgi:multiple RNA-binding domain-containing protein 1
MQDAEPEPRQDDVSDLEWMKQRMSKNVDVIEKAFEQSDDEGEPPNKEILVKRPIFFIYITLTL